MPPGYKPPSVETIHEPLHGEHDSVAQGCGNPEESEEETRTVHNDQLNTRLLGSAVPKDGREANSGRHRSASPKLHHILKSRPRSVGRNRMSAILAPTSPRSRSAHSHHRYAPLQYEQQKLKPDEGSGDDGTESDGRSSGSGCRSGSWLASKGAPREQRHVRVPSPSTLSTLTDLTVATTATGGSGSSSGSSSTIKETSLALKDKDGSVRQTSRGQGPDTPHPDAFRFLDPESPAITDESIKQTITASAKWQRPSVGDFNSSPTSQSTSSVSSHWSMPCSDAPSERTADTDISTSPGRGVDGDDTPGPPSSISAENSGPQTLASSRRQQRAYRHDKYGTPEMPRGSANLPHVPGNALGPRLPAQGQMKHLPRAEKLPLSGYELLASRISSSSTAIRSRRNSILSSASPTSSYQLHGHSDSVASSAQSDGTMNEQPIKPIYRRFEALNHRLLLHLQDELSELEEQLHRLDTADTQTRRLRNKILPASRRTDFLTGGELQWHKTDILGKIGFKLGQYNHVLSSFTSTRDLPSPSLSDVDDYRAYLAVHQPISEVETRFLDPVDDLATLATSPQSSSSDGSARSDKEKLSRDDFQSLSDGALTPMPGRIAGRGSWPVGLARGLSSSLATSSPSPSSSSDSRWPRTANVAKSTAPAFASSRSLKLVTDITSRAGGAPSLIHAAVAVAVAVLAPTLTFPFIPGFVGKMTVVLLVGLSIMGSTFQSGVLTGTGSRDMVLSAAVYGVMMGVVAGVVG